VYKRQITPQPLVAGMKLLGVTHYPTGGCRGCVKRRYNPAAIYTDPTSTERLMMFFKALGAGRVVLLAFLGRLWRPGMGEVLFDTDKGDWIRVVGIFGTLLVLIALA
jgi:hypothetical protein